MRLQREVKFYLSHVVFYDDEISTTFIAMILNRYNTVYAVLGA